MKIVIQRVQKASVIINKETAGSIGKGMLILVGIENDDGSEDVSWLINKVLNLRIFDDLEGVMNLNINQVKGEILAISQFTLQASTKKGNRPSYSKAASPNIAIPIYNNFIEALDSGLETTLSTGKFGAVMQVSLVNNGPVTIIIDSKNRV